jgi:hypothetical protein
MLYLSQKTEGKNRMWLLVWSYAGIVSLTSLWIRSMLCAPSTMQKWGYEIPNYLMVHFPGSWIVTVIIPVLLFAQLAAVLQVRLLNRN